MIFLHEPNVSTVGSMSDAERAAYFDRWQPSGHDNWHKMTLEYAQDDSRNVEVSLVVPAVDSWEMAEARVSRIGGRTEADKVFAAQLYQRIGAATVAGGRIEAAMKRLILSMAGLDAPAFRGVDETWSELERQLRKAAISKGEYATEVLKLMDWAVDHKIKEIRDDIVHAYWWDYAGVGVVRGRFNRVTRLVPDAASELIHITPEELDQQCRLLAWYAEALDTIGGLHWLEVSLPRGQAQPREA